MNSGGRLIGDSTALGRNNLPLHTPAGRDSQLQNAECKEPGTRALTLWFIYIKFKGRQTCRIGSPDSGNVGNEEVW